MSQKPFSTVKNSCQREKILKKGFQNDLTLKPHDQILLRRDLK